MMLTSKDKFVKQVLVGFQNLKGKASVYCFAKTVIPELVYNVVTSFYRKHPDQQIFIGVDTYDTRRAIMHFLISNDVTKEKGYDIKILSTTYMNTKYSYHCGLAITVGINDDYALIKHLKCSARFMLAVLTKNIMDNDFITSVRNILPAIDTVDVADTAKNDFIYSPVEECRHGVDMSDDDRTLYNKYTDYINTSVSIFGDLSNIEKCKIGDVAQGISAASFRNMLARDNGWSENLDTSIDFMKQIDDVYNPNVLFNRACNFYNIAKERRCLVYDNNAKLEIIKDICVDNKDKKIVIVSKREEYAAKVTKYLNECTDLKCGDYHDCIEPATMVDEYGVPVIIKSGVNKGKPRIMCAQAQSSMNEKMFNSGTLNVLSIKSSSNPKLDVACDIVIFTSPLCGGIISFRKRFTNVTFNNVPTVVHRIYCSATIEADAFNKEKMYSNIKVIDDTDNFIGYDENSGDIIL